MEVHPELFISVFCFCYCIQRDNIEGRKLITSSKWLTLRVFLSWYIWNKKTCTLLCLISRVMSANIQSISCVWNLLQINIHNSDFLFCSFGLLQSYYSLKWRSLSLVYGGPSHQYIEEIVYNCFRLCSTRGNPAHDFIFLNNLHLHLCTFILIHWTTLSNGLLKVIQ